MRKLLDGSDRFTAFCARVESLPPSFKQDVFWGGGKCVQNFSQELRREKSDCEKFDVKMGLQEVKS